MSSNKKWRYTFLLVVCIAFILQGAFAEEGGAPEIAGVHAAVGPSDRNSTPDTKSAIKREAQYATDEIYKAITPMLIAERSETKGGAGFSLAVGGAPDADKLLAIMYEGMDLVLDEEYEKAIPKLEAVIEAEPTLLAVWSTLGWTYWKVGRQDDAIRLWKRLLVLDPTQPTAHLLMGNAYVGTGRLREAEFHLKKSLELAPQQLETRLVLSTVYRWTGRYLASIEILQTLRAEYPDRLDIQNELGKSLFENGSYEEALPLLEQGIRAVPDDRELALVHARCLLRTGNMAEAQLRARRLLRDNDSDFELLLLLADAPRYNNTPAESIPFLKKIARSATNKQVATEANVRLIEIYTQLWEKQPEKYPLNDALDSARALLEIDPGNQSWKQSYGELLMMNQQYAAAKDEFNKVLSASTTNVLVARAGLFEVGQASSKYKMGKENLDFVTSVNPLNPYLNQMVARLELSRGNVTGAYAAIDKLEAAGARGAVAVLQYNGLVDSDWADVMSARRFRLQMLALKQAGFRFLFAQQIPAYFAELEKPPSELSEHRPKLAVVVMFDQADDRTLRLATEVAEDLDLVFSLAVPVGLVDSDNLGIAGKALLLKLADSGRWSFGSMLNDAVKLVPVRPDGRLGSSLANRLWIEKDEMYESELEYTKRLRSEYSKSRGRLRELLEGKSLVSFVAYPSGEYGQGLLSNVDDAIQQNLNEAAINYELGFIQSVFGYAVNGDNPLLYQRYIPGLFDSGEDIVDHLIMNQPVFLARRMRAEFAALDGRLYRAQKNLAWLRRDGYSERPYNHIEAFVYDHLALKFGISKQTEKADKGQFKIEIEHPYGGGQFDWFKDSLGSRNWRNAYYAGLHLTPAINAEVRGGYGAYRQHYSANLARETETPVLEQRNARVTETFVGGRIGMRYEPVNPKRSPVSFNAGLERHEFRKDANFDDWNYMLEMAFRPVLYYDVLLNFTHDVIPSARAMVEDGTTADQYAYAGAFRIRDWWDLWTRANYYDISDGNERLHADISSMWELAEEPGLLGGIEYGYVDAKYSKLAYWTPYRMNQWLLVAELRKNFYRFYYDVALKFGYAQEDIRPEDQVAYDRLVVQARRYRFDPGKGPKSEWIEVFSANAALRMSLGRHWQAYWEGLYNESVNYHEYKTIAGLNFWF